MAETTIEVVAAPTELTEAELDDIMGAGSGIIAPPCNGGACATACESK